MPAKTRERLLTAEEFYHLPDSPEGGKMELAYGKVIIMSPVGRPHSTTTLNIAYALREFVRPRGLGEVHVELGYRLRRDPDLVRAPDVSLLANDQLQHIADEGFADTHPTLAVEVLSPDDRRGEVLAKVGEYLDAGTPVVWVVDPRARTVTVHHLDGRARTFAHDETLTAQDAALETPGFTLPLADVFD